jgi:hypothetical protein
MLTFEDIPCFILAMPEARKELLGDLLKAMSRSFYLIPLCGTRAARARAPANRPHEKNWPCV